jgi:hypothetical protein
VTLTFSAALPASQRIASNPATFTSTLTWTASTGP